MAQQSLVKTSALISRSRRRCRTSTSSRVCFVARKVTGEAPFALDFVVRASREKLRPSDGEEETVRPPIPSETVSAWLAAGSRSFSEHFRETFSLEDKGFEAKDVVVAKTALSNMLGGMGHFVGKSKVRGAGRGGGDGVSFEASLFTAVPSRSFFPRGFLWDEGFHQVRGR